MKKMAMMCLVKSGQRRSVSMPIEAMKEWMLRVFQTWDMEPSLHTEYVGNDTWLDRHGRRWNLRTNSSNDLVAYVWIEE